MKELEKLLDDLIAKAKEEQNLWDDLDEAGIEQKYKMYKWIDETEEEIKKLKQEILELCEKVN